MKPIHWVVIALAACLTIATGDGLRIRDKYSISIGRYQAELDGSKTLNGEKDKAITAQTIIIADLDKKLTTSAQVIGHLTNAIGQQDADLTQLASKLHRLEAVGDLPAQVANLKEQVAVWSGKFSLAQSVIAEKDAIISAWAAKYAAAIQIGEAWKAKYDAECRLLTLATQGWKVAENKLRWTRVTGNVKTGIIIAAAIKIGADMIKGT